MKNLTILIITLLAAFAIDVQAQEFKLDNKKSEINWTGKAAFNSYSLTGTLASEEGNIVIKDNQIETLEVVIDMKSLNHENKRLKSHLRGKDFFEVKKYTKATFTLDKSTDVKDGHAELSGTLKIKNSAHSEKIKAVVMIQDDKVLLTFNTEIDRTKYGVKFNSPTFFKKMKENAIADAFKLEGGFVFVK
jgi:polyisoprenoid-binding protein YceI